MAFRYEFVVETGRIDMELMKRLPAGEIARQMTVSLNQLARRVSNALRTRPDGPWEIVSHDVANVGEFSTVTFLIRREDSW